MLNPGGRVRLHDLHHGCRLSAEIVRLMGGEEQEMIVYRIKAVYRLPDGTCVVNTSDALKQLASA